MLSMGAITIVGQSFRPPLVPKLGLGNESGHSQNACAHCAQIVPVKVNFF